jgi:hypothetical protein
MLHIYQHTYINTYIHTWTYIHTHTTYTLTYIDTHTYVRSIYMLPHICLESRLDILLYISVQVRRHIGLVLHRDYVFFKKNWMILHICQFRLYILVRFTFVQIKWCSGSCIIHLTNFNTLNSILKFGSRLMVFPVQQLGGRFDSL